MTGAKPINTYMQGRGLNPSEAWKLKGLLRMDDLRTLDEQVKRFEKYMELIKSGDYSKNEALAKAVAE